MIWPVSSDLQKKEKKSVRYSSHRIREKVCWDSSINSNAHLFGCHFGVRADRRFIRGSSLAAFWRPLSDFFFNFCWNVRFFSILLWFWGEEKTISEGTLGIVKKRYWHCFPHNIAVSLCQWILNHSLRLWYVTCAQVLPFFLRSLGIKSHSRPWKFSKLPLDTNRLRTLLTRCTVV